MIDDKTIIITTTTSNTSNIRIRHRLLPLNTSLFTSLPNNYQLIHHQQQQQRRQRRRRRETIFELQSSSSSQSTSSNSISSSSSSSSSTSSSSTTLQSNAQRYQHYVPQFVHEPHGSIHLSNQYGGIIPCSVQLINTINGQVTTIVAPSSTVNDDANNPIERIYWEVRDARTLDDSHYNVAVDIVDLREQRPDGSLAFLPFQHESSLIGNELHNALYRCVAVTSIGTIVSRSILVTLGMYCIIV